MSNLRQAMMIDEMLEKYVRKIGQTVTAGEVVRDLRLLGAKHPCENCLYLTEPNKEECKQCKKNLSAGKLY